MRTTENGLFTIDDWISPEDPLLSRSRKTLENQLNLGSDRTELLEVQLKEARALASESDKKYDEVSDERRSYSGQTFTDSF